MYTEQRSLKHCRQERATLDANISALRVEGNKLAAIPAEKRRDSDRARLTAIDTEYDGLARRAAEVAAEIVGLESANAELIASVGDIGMPATAPRATGRRYAEMFPALRIHAGGFHSSDEFLATLHSGLADPRLIPTYTPQLSATMTVATPSDGGFSVPPMFFQQWLDSSLESEIVRSRADLRPMSSSDAVAAAWDDGDHSSTLFGGFSGQWVDEGNTITEQQPKMRLINLHARKLAILARTSNELAADGVNFESQLGQAITRALGFFLDTAFISGNGAAAPFGVLNAPCTITVSKETSQPAATILYSNVVKMFSRLNPPSIPKAIWLANSSAIPQLLQLSMPIGTGGSHVPVLSESNGTWRMLTLPVIFSEKMQTLGTKGDIMLADFSSYVVGLRSDFTLAKSSHAGFASDTSYFRGLIRVDGQPKLSAPVTPAHGDTLSPFVVLQTRA